MFKLLILILYNLFSYTFKIINLKNVIFKLLFINYSFTHFFFNLIHRNLTIKFFASIVPQNWTKNLKNYPESLGY